jgi:hypothetical protein
MIMTTFTAGPLTPLQGLDVISLGVNAYMDGEGRRFLLIKDASHNWGLWEQVGSALEERVVPLPGGKDEADASLIFHDNKIIVYFAARLDSDARPAQMCEITAPGVRRLPWMGHIRGINKELNAQRARMDALTARLGAAGEASLEGRVVALEDAKRRIREALGE